MVRPNLAVNIGGLALPNPVLVASGTFGFVTPSGMTLSPTGNPLYIEANGTRSNTVTVYPTPSLALSASPGSLPNAGGTLTIDGVANGLPDGTVVKVSVEIIGVKNGVAYPEPTGGYPVTSLPSATVSGGVFSLSYAAQAIPPNVLNPYTAYGAYLEFTATATAPDGTVVKSSALPIPQGTV